MAKTCIVCGNAAGSREHVFPAALGGRRMNSGIYCTTHDNGYSGLVREIAGQLDFLNAYLGVRPDHSDEIKVVYAEDPLTGLPISISANEIRFTKPRVISRTPAGEGIAVQIAFPDRRSSNKWRADMESEGYTVTLQSNPSEGRYMIRAIHHSRSFGGACGLGAVAYVTQTFFTQEFPQIARSGVLSDFIAYTQAIAKVAALGGYEQSDGERAELTAAKSYLASALAPFGGSAPVWMDFDPIAGLTPNSFEFGHRVVVGVDGSDGLIYGRLSLFSFLNFAVYLGVTPPGAKTCEVTIDIDPLAEHPPNDIKKFVAYSSQSRIKAPQISAEDNADALACETQRRTFEGLLERLTDHQLVKLAHAMETTLAQLSIMPAFEGQALIAQTIDEQSQQVWRATTSVIHGLKEKMIEAGIAGIAPMLDMLIAHDANSASGLSPQAEATLALAKAALVAQFEQDCAAGLLNEERIADLMGRGHGLHIIGEAVLSPLRHILEQNL